MAINKQAPWHIQAYPDGQVDVTNGLVVLNVQPFMPESLMWSGMTKDEIDRIKIEFARFVQLAINREVRAEQERG